MAEEHTQVSRYGPIRQTLPVQTQAPTQLMSHELHQFTQLIDHDSVEHVRCDTMVNYTSLEGPGNTLVLHDDDAPGSSPRDQRDDAQSALPLQVEGGVTADDHGTIDALGLAPSKEYAALNILDSDATTEEGDVDGIGYLDADAESRPTLFDTTGDTEARSVKVGEKYVEIVQLDLPGVVNVGNGAPDNLALQRRTPEADFVADVTGMKSSQSRPMSIASVHTAPLAASQSASLDSTRKDGVKFDSDATVELTPGVLNGELTKPFEALDPQLCAAEAPHATKAAGFDSMQSLPKAVLPSETVHSPRICTSTCVSPAGASLQQASEQDNSDHIDLDATVELDTNAIEGLSPFGRVPGMPKTGIDRPESMSTPLESLTLGLKSHDQDIGASPGAKVKKEPSTQKQREISLTTLTDKLDGGGNAVLKALETECENASGKPISVIQAPTREQQFRLPLGFRAASTNLSYLKSQEPGEETQVNAFNMVDKLVWLETTCLSDDIVTSPVPQDGSIKDHAVAKGRQSLAQAAQMKTVRDKLDVFDWEDSQVDKADTPPEAKQVPVNVRSRKRQSEAYKPMTARKKQATSDQQKIKTSCIENKGDDSAIAGRENNTPDVAKTQVYPSSSNQEAKPHTLLTTRLRNRTKAESGPTAKGRKSSSLKSRPSKRVGKEKQIDESCKDFEAGQQKGSDNIKVKVQQAGLSGNSERRKRAGRKKSVDESGKDLKIEQQKGGDSEGNKFLQADSLSAKGKKDLLKTSKVGPEIQGNLGLADRTSQDDAAADMWIEAFANTKNKTMGNDVELIKFRKRSALHEGTGQDSKKCRTMEPATVSRDDEHQDAFEKEETSLNENRVETELNKQQHSKRPENIDTAKISRHNGRRVSTRHSRGENQDLEKKENNLVEEQLITKSKKPRTADTQVKVRRVSTRDHRGEHQDVSKREDILMKEDIAKRGLKTRLDPKQCKTADAAILPPVKSRGVRTRGEVEHLNAMENRTSDGMLERGPKTRSKAQDVKNMVAGSDTTHVTTNDKDGQSLSTGAMQADFKVANPSTKTSRSKKKESSLSHQDLTSELNWDAQEIEADPFQAGPPPINVNEGALVGGPKRRKRREAEAVVPESTKAGGNSLSQPKEEDTDKSMSKMEELGCSKKDDVSQSTVLRRTRSNMCDDFVDVKKDGVQSHVESATEEQTPQNHTGIFDANKGLKKQVAKSDTKTTKSMPRRNKKTSAPEMLEKLSSSDGGRRRKREPGCIRVLFSHNLTEDKIKHQKKILAKLGGQLAMSASDCTHFVSNGFVRTQNMLISMATGKIVATPLWLENCGQAHYFVDAKKHILQDEKKEKELGFSMTASIASAERKPLLKGVQVLVCPNTVPEPAVLQAIVESAGGQVMDIQSCSSPLVAKENDTLLLIIANEKDLDFCLQFLDKGLKVYSEELVLHGIVTQTLDFSRNRLFEDFKQQKGLKRASNINANSLC